MIGVIDGIVVGAVGGALAGLTLWLSQLAREKRSESRDRDKVYEWLRERTEGVSGKRYRSTRAIASWTNLTEDRVRYVCSVDPRIHLGTADKEKEMWTLVEREEPSVYEE